MSAMEKSQLRDRYCAAREALPASQVAADSAALCRRLAAMAPIQAADTVLGYLAFRNELDLGLLFELLPDTNWALPRIDSGNLILHPYQPENLVRHRFGMLEPVADAPVVEAQELEVVLVPGVAFDSQGGRLGLGGGFYDRFLLSTPAIRIGVCHDVCLAQDLPTERHDQRMDWVVTPTVTFHCAPRWRRGEG